VHTILKLFVKTESNSHLICTCLCELYDIAFQLLKLWRYLCFSFNYSHYSCYIGRSNLQPAVSFRWTSPFCTRWENCSNIKITL